MIKRSKIDYFANSFFSTILASIFSGTLFYFYRYELIGRWVLVISAIGYLVLDFSFLLIACRYRKNSIQVVGFGLRAISKILEDLRLAGVCNSYSLTELRACDELFENKMLESVPIEKKVFLSPQGDPRLQEYFFLKNLLDLLPNLMSVNNFLETEVELIPLDSVYWSSWPDVSSKIRQAKYAKLKRMLDISLVILFCLPGCLLILLAGLLIKIFDRGPIFYSQIRLGQFEIPFKIYKLRTMRVDSEIAGPQWAKVGDARVTFIGKLLRKTRFDELPQMWNVLCGEMSFIGPRPERPEMYRMVEADLPQFKLRLACKPGLTGWAQVNYPYGASVTDAGVKLMFDLYYLKNYSILLEFRVLMRTFVAMVKGAR